MSSTTFFKAIRPDGGSFHNPKFAWATELGGITTHPDGATSLRGVDAADYLSVSTSPTDCTGMQWPCRLLEVEPVGETWTPDAANLPSKRAGYQFRTVRELPANDAFGPQGSEVAALVERARRVNASEINRLYAARDTAGYTARYTARDAARDTARIAARDTAGYAAGYAARDEARIAARDHAWDAAWDAAWDPAGYAARDTARDAARALVVRDLIGQTGFTQAHYDTMTAPWREAIGHIHADDKEMT